MSNDEKLFNFMSGLQGWAQTELRRQRVQDLPTAMATADCLVDYKMVGAIDNMPKSKPYGLKKSKADGQRNGKLWSRRAGRTCSRHPKGMGASYSKVRLEPRIVQRGRRCPLSNWTVIQRMGT